MREREGEKEGEKGGGENPVSQEHRAYTSTHTARAFLLPLSDELVNRYLI